MDAPDTATLVAKIALEKKADDVAILEVTDLVGYADYFVIATGRNARHVAAIAEGVRTTLKRQFGLPPSSVEGVTAGRWVLVDYGSVVLHVFDGTARSFYNLEGLWSSARRLPLPDVKPEHDEPIFSFPS